MRTIVAGGLPQLGPMQVPAGTRGAESYSSFDLDADMEFAMQVNASTNSSLPDRDVDFYITYAGFNIKDAVRQESDVPLQFTYEPADCRIFYTVNTVYNYENLWNYVVDAFWRNPSLCIAGSTTYVPPNPTMDTSGPSDEQKQQWKTVQPDSVASLILSGHGHVKRDEDSAPASPHEKRALTNNKPTTQTSELSQRKKRHLITAHNPSRRRHLSKKKPNPRHRRALHQSIKAASPSHPENPHQKRNAGNHLPKPNTRTPNISPALHDLTTAITDDTFNPNACQKCSSRQICASIPTCSRSGGAVTYTTTCKPACVTRAPNDGCPSGQSCSRDGKTAFCDVPRVVAQVRTCAKLAKAGGGGGGGKKLSDTHPPAVLGGGKSKIPYGRQVYGQGGSYSRFVPKAIGSKRKVR